MRNVAFLFFCIGHMTFFNQHWKKITRNPSSNHYRSVDICIRKTRCRQMRQAFQDPAGILPCNSGKGQDFRIPVATRHPGS